MNLLKYTHGFDENERNRVCNMSEKNGNTFKKDRVEKKVKAWREIKEVSRERNKIQKITGINLTAKVERKVPY